MANKIALDNDFPVITESDKIYARALQVQKPVTQTLAKGPGQFSNGVAPKYIVKGKGSHVWDADGNEYIDLNSAIGPISLGYAYPAVDNAIRKQLEDGITFSLMHPLEVELGLLKVVPEKYLLHAHHWLILHGRYVCKARTPECYRCIIAEWCRFTPRTPPPKGWDGAALR